MRFMQLAQLGASCRCRWLKLVLSRSRCCAAYFASQPPCGNCDDTCSVIMSPGRTQRGKADERLAETQGHSEGPSDVLNVSPARWRQMREPERGQTGRAASSASSNLMAGASSNTGTI